MKKLRFTTDELRAEKGAFLCGYRLIFYSTGFDLCDDPNWMRGQMVGALFMLYTERDDEGVDRLVHRPIAGSNPVAPLHAKIELLSAPAGEPENWTAGQIADCEFRFWIPPEQLPDYEKRESLTRIFHHLAKQQPCPPDEPAPSS